MPNHLINSPSLYLRKHAENPISWWYWCDEALGQARAGDKPIFLSIGYSSCHWCTVMEGEAFSDPDIAAYLNANFVAIKVDREERPDLDSIYMQALQMMTDQGGWPLNIFLDPSNLLPFYGGTYFPVQPRYGRPGFLQVLQSLRHFYDHDKTKLAQITTEIAQNLSKGVELAPLTELPQLAPTLLSEGAAVSNQIVGRVAPGTRFPMIPYADLVLRGADVACAQQRGIELATGGIFDHVAGGFHRYTVDPTWTVPHFEKMLYDNGLIVEFLANLWSSGCPKPAFQRAIALTVDWLRREMTAPQGYFYASQDADSFATTQEPEEGAFYVWRFEELSAILSPEQLAALGQEFYLELGGNFEGAIVLQRRSPETLDPLAEDALSKLFQSRYGSDRSLLTTFGPAPDNTTAQNQPWPGRIPPVTDTKMIVAWNSLMISGLARAAAVFAQSDYLDLALGAAQFIVENQWSDGELYRIYYDTGSTVTAQAEDYAYWIKACLDLHQAIQAFGSMEMANFWLETALTAQQAFDDRLGSETGGYYNTTNDLIIRERAYYDSATPAANGVALANLVRLFLLTGEQVYLEQASRGLASFGQVLKNTPQACPSLFVALDWYLNATLIKTNAETIARLGKEYLPTSMGLLELDLPGLAVVCKGLACLAPVHDYEQLLEQASS